MGKKEKNWIFSNVDIILRAHGQIHCSLYQEAKWEELRLWYTPVIPVVSEGDRAGLRV